MKIAVCVSGICRGNVQQNLEHARYHFPTADYFFATWKNRDEDITSSLGQVNYQTYDEPIMQYHPVLDIHEFPAPKLIKHKKQRKSGKLDEVWEERTVHHTKQILIHNMLLRDLPSEYDMIIRLRYDTFLSKEVDFSNYLTKSYNEKIAIGFGTRWSRHKNLDQLVEVPKIYPDGKNDSISQDWGWYLMDPLIFHPRVLWNHDLVDTLHNSKRLVAAEYGWFQILSEPYDHNHLSVYGGAHIEKYLQGLK